MDRAEAIKYLEISSEEIENYGSAFLASVGKHALDMAIAALREQEKSNEPLAFSQLWDMAGEPIWIVWPDGRIKSKWWIVGSHEWHMMGFTDSQSAREYGTVWIAYRKPPEGGAEE